MKEKYKHYYEIFGRIFNTLFPSALSWVNFMFMWMFMFAMWVGMQEHNPIKALISALGTIYCLNEWDKRIERK